MAAQARFEAAIMARPGSGHPGLLRAGDDDVHAPGVHLEWNRTKAGDAIDQDQRIGSQLADGGRQFRDRVHHRGRGLVVGEQDGLVPAVPLELGTERGRIGRLAPFDFDLGDVGAVGSSDLGEPVAKGTDGDTQHAIARRQRIDDRRLEAARAGRRDDRDVAGRPEVGLHPGQDPFEHRRELGAAMIDHLARTGFADAWRQARRAGNAQVWLEAVHGTSWMVVRACADGRTA